MAEVDPYRAYRELERWLFYTPGLGGIPANWRDGAEVIMRETLEAEIVTVVNVVQTCGACPSQWEGRTDDGRPVYVRYRHGSLTVGVGKPDQDIECAVAASMSFRALVDKQVGDEWAGVMSFAELVEHTRGVIEWKAEGGREREW